MNFSKTHNLYQKDLKEVARLCLKDVGWAQRAQTSAKVSNLNQKWSGIRVRISGLIWIRIRISAG